VADQTQHGPPPSSLRLPSPSWRLRVLSVAVITLCAVTLGAFIRIAWQYPAPSIPALLGALAGTWVSFRARDAHALHWLLFRDSHAFFGRLYRYSIGAGASGYGLLAALGVGVPDASVAVTWRLFGGLAIGALAGAGAALFGITLYCLALMVLIQSPITISTRHPVA
jgi:hypothetical protein